MIISEKKTLFSTKGGGEGWKPLLKNPQKKIIFFIEAMYSRKDVNIT